MSENKDVPAQQRFAGDRAEPELDSRSGGSDDFDLDNDIDLEVETESRAKPRGMPVWIKGVIGMTLLTLLAGGGFVVFKVLESKKNASQEVLYENPPPQPVIAAAPAAHQVPVPAAAQSGGQVATQGLLPSDPAKLLPASAGAPATLISPAPSPPISSQLVQAPVAAVQPAQRVQSPVDPAAGKTPDDSSLRTDLVQAQKDAQVAKKSVQDLEARVQVLEAQIAKLISVKPVVQTAPVAAASKHISQKPTDAKVAAVSPVDRVGKAPAAPKAVASVKNPISTQKESFSQPDTPKLPKVVSGAVITGIIGNRAFIVRHGEDGKEMEISVMPGDFFDGVRVSNVNGSDREVGLADGRVIKTQSNLKN